MLASRLLPINAASWALQNNAPQAFRAGVRLQFLTGNRLKADYPMVAIPMFQLATRSWKKSVG